MSNLFDQEYQRDQDQMNLRNSQTNSKPSISLNKTRIIGWGAYLRVTTCSVTPGFSGGLTIGSKTPAAVQPGHATRHETETSAGR